MRAVATTRVKNGILIGATFIVFKIVNAVKSMRVTKEAEQDGLDVPEFGFLGYPEDVYSTET